MQSYNSLNKRRVNTSCTQLPSWSCSKPARKSLFRHHKIYLWFPKGFSAKLQDFYFIFYCPNVVKISVNNIVFKVVIIPGPLSYGGGLFLHSCYLLVNVMHQYKLFLNDYYFNMAGKYAILNKTIHDINLLDKLLFLHLMFDCVKNEWWWWQLAEDLQI